MATVKELKKALDLIDDNLEVFIYPKYSFYEVDGYKKHSFLIQNVCEQEPWGFIIKDDKKKRNRISIEKNQKITILIIILQLFFSYATRKTHNKLLRFRI